MDTDSDILSVNAKFVIKELKNLEDLFDFSNLNGNHELFSNKNRKVIGKFEIETSNQIWIDDFVCLRSKMFSFKCGVDSRNKLKGVGKSYSKNFNCEEYKKSLDGDEYQQEFDNCVI